MTNDSFNPPAVIPQSPYGSQKPGKVQTVAIMTLISGIINILVGLICNITLFIYAFFTLGITCLCMPFFVALIVLGVFEIIYATQLMATPMKTTKPSQALAICEIVAIITGSVYSVVVGIVALVMYNDPEVKAFFAQAAYEQPIIS
jgi:hypothetical protein